MTVDSDDPMDAPLDAPFRALRVPVTPLAPRPAFAAELRARLRQRLGIEHRGGTMETGTTPAPAPDAPPAVQAVTPYLCARGADDAIAFYSAVFGATVEGDIIREPDGRVGHAELTIGGMRVFISDEYEEYGVYSPSSRGGTTVSFVVVVDDIDTAWHHAVERGATVERPITVAYGMRGGWFVDPWGHRWNVGELVEG